MFGEEEEEYPNLPIPEFPKGASEGSNGILTIGTLANQNSIAHCIGK